jgi:hypothetical protein
MTIVKTDFSRACYTLSSVCIGWVLYQLTRPIKNVYWVGERWKFIRWIVAGRIRTDLDPLKLETSAHFLLQTPWKSFRWDVQLLHADKESAGSDTH